MNETLSAAFSLLGQGMAGIFTVLIIISLVVALLGRVDNRKKK